MKERARRLEGELIIESRPRNGTSIRVIVPASARRARKWSHGSADNSDRGERLQTLSIASNEMPKK
jgi:hypothetical protein